jgi:hypothetical protein
VVTSFQYRLRPLGPTVLAGLMAWPLEQAPRVLRSFRDFMAAAPDEVGIMANLRLAPSMPFIPEHLHGRPIVALVICYAGPVDRGQAALSPLRELGTPAVDAVVAKPYLAHQSMFDAALPHGRHYYWKSWKLPPLTDATIGVIAEQASGLTSPHSMVSIFALGGAVARVDDEATAFTGRSPAHDINFVASWLPDDPEPERHKAWARGSWEAMRPFGHGVYVNFLADEPQAHVKVAYGERKYACLAALKRTYDPTNFFRLNQNIAPAGSIQSSPP